MDMKSEYILRKRFKLPIGHRLSKHNGLCKNIHGHNIMIEVALKTNSLNENDMVIDFADVKLLMNDIITEFDHCCLLNKNDENIEFMKKQKMKLFIFDGDPTAENLSKYIYNVINKKIKNDNKYQYICLHSIRIWENENSDITHSF